MKLHFQFTVLATVALVAMSTPVNAQQHITTNPSNRVKHASAPQGMRSIVGLATYPKRNVRLVTAVGPVNGLSGERVREDTPFRIASITKTFTAAAVFKLIERGRFTLDSPIKDLLRPEVAAQLQTAKVDPAAITIRQLLGHRSGLFDYATTQAYIGTILTNPGKKWARAEQLAIALTVGAPLPPDSAYLYADTNYILLGDVLERATGQSLATSYRTLLNFAGLGLRQTYLETVELVPAGLNTRLHSFVQGFDTYDIDASFDLYGGGGLVSTAADLTRFFRALFSGRIVNKTSFRAMTSAVSGGGFGEFAYSLGLMPFFIGNNACYGHEGFASVVVGHCPGIDYTFVYAAGSDQIPGVALTNQGIGFRVAKSVGIDVAPKPYSKKFELTRCPPELLSKNVRLTCGMMAVRESRGDFPSRTIRFPVVIAKHPTKPARIEPLLLLGGGPGDALLPSLPNLFADPDASSALLNGQDLVAVEYRGVGAAKPQLTCDSILNDNESITACLGKFSALGVDLSRYNSVEIATDLEQLRRSLRISRWNVLGFSFGTRAALTMLRERPSTIKSLSLDGAFPPETPFDDPELFTRTLDEVFVNCQNDTDCDRAFPNLKRRLVDSLNALNQSPIQINGRPVSGDDVIQTLVILQSNPELLAYLPAVLDGFANRNVDLLSTFFSAVGDSTSLDLTFSAAMFFSVECNEEVPFIDRVALSTLAAGSDPIRRSIAKNVLKNADVCMKWPSGLGSSRENQPVPLSVPTIVFNGQFDLQTPPQTGRRLGVSTALARSFDFPAIGHIALQQSPGCAITILADFQRNQDPHAVDASCLADLRGIRWKNELDKGFFQLLVGDQNRQRSR